MNTRGRDEGAALLEVVKVHATTDKHVAGSKTSRKRCLIRIIWRMRLESVPQRGNTHLTSLLEHP